MGFPTFLKEIGAYNSIGAECGEKRLEATAALPFGSWAVHKLQSAAGPVPARRVLRKAGEVKPTSMADTLLSRALDSSGQGIAPLYHSCPGHFPCRAYPKLVPQTWSWEPSHEVISTMLLWVAFAVQKALQL